MTKLDKSIYDNLDELSNNFLYLKQETKEAYLYNIFKVVSLEKNKYTNQITYQTDKYYMLFVPKLASGTTFIYDTYKTISLGFNDLIFKMTQQEYLDTFRSFLSCEGKRANELPSKIIQDVN